MRKSALLVFLPATYFFTLGFGSGMADSPVTRDHVLSTFFYSNGDDEKRTETFVTWPAAATLGYSLGALLVRKPAPVPEDENPPA